MTFCSGLFRLAALSLLLSAATDLIAVDMFGVFWQEKATVQSELQGSCSEDGCFCCSPSTVPATPAALAPSPFVTSAEPLKIAAAPVVAVDPLFHPPRT
jgi:hypothetical protein